jgi:DNA-directed RNA polymerase specialized sigma24 family protein
MNIPRDTAADLEGYQLFRQAVAEGNADAWATIADRYRRQMVAWANHCRARMPIHELATDIADQALARAWSALAAARFETFPSLAAFLAYLRTCVMATTIDHAREQNARSRNEQLAHIEAAGVSLEQAVLEQINQAELWCLILSVAKSEQEQLLVRESLIDALPPRAIQARHPDQFADVAMVYRMKRNLFKRLQHNQAIERFCYEETLAQNRDT